MWRDVSVLCVFVLRDVACCHYCRRCVVGCVSVGVDALAVVWWERFKKKKICDHKKNSRWLCLVIFGYVWLC